MSEEEINKYCMQIYVLLSRNGMFFDLEMTKRGAVGMLKNKIAVCVACQSSTHMKRKKSFLSYFKKISHARIDFFLYHTLRKEKQRNKKDKQEKGPSQVKSNRKRSHDGDN